MKKFLFLTLVFCLSLADSLTAQTGTATSERFLHCLNSMQNHNPGHNGGQSIIFKPQYPCLIVGGYSINSAGVKTVWGVHQSSTYARWDTLGTIEAINGAYRFVQMGNEWVTQDALYLPSVGTYTLDWLKLAGYPLPSGFQSFGVSVAVFDPTDIR